VAGKLAASCNLQYNAAERCFLTMAPHVVSPAEFGLLIVYLIQPVHLQNIGLFGTSQLLQNYFYILQTSILEPLLMSIAALISGLPSLAHNVEHIIDAFCSFDAQSTKGDYTVLTALSERFSKAAVRFLDQINELKEKRAQWAREEERNFVSAAESAAAELTEKGRLKSLATFKRNIVLIFQGPQESNLDSPSDKSRHKVTRKRCQQIRSIKPNKVLV
jgi:hypothetical protein